MSLEIVSRSGWGARTNRTGRPMGRVSKLIVHHAWRPDVPVGASAATERAVMRGMEAFHASKGWSAAPGYQFVVMPSGRAYVCAGFGRSGVHTAGYNASSIALQHAINGDAHDATAAAWQAMAALAALAVDRGYLTRNYNLYGHTDFAAKSCPGRIVYPKIGRVRTGTINGGGGTAPDEETEMVLEHGMNIGTDVPAWVANEIGELQQECNRLIDQALGDGIVRGGSGAQVYKLSSRPAWHPLAVDEKYGDDTWRSVGKCKDILGYRGDGRRITDGCRARIVAVAWTSPAIIRAELGADRQRELHADGSPHMTPAAVDVDVPPLEVDVHLGDTTATRVAELVAERVRTEPAG